MAHFGIGVSTAVTAVPDTLKLAVQADRGGLDLITVSDHPYYPDRLDAYAELGVLLGKTERVSGLVSVTNLPTRPAAMLARTITSLSALTGGRIVLGMGVGGLWDDIARLGFTKLTPGQAVRAFEEGIRLVKLLGGGGDPVSFDGEFYQVTELVPAEETMPPVWTGSVGPKSLAVTGRVADGWMPGRAADWLSERYRTSRPVIDEAAVAAGRDPGEIATVYNFPGRITAEPLAQTRAEDGRWIGGSSAQWVEELTGAVLEHGAAGFVLFGPDRSTPDEVAAARWAGEIVPAVREAVAK
ncbi:coenzyme F420-dependent N5,N10-methenyltetrahydromethanopterin reductase [Amycolatopsis mediterranei S699]|uniref:Coenzyme F420-dependent N5,N10-methenyltetrahydromethanopterin reductase n=2 Tax=Amycolatopsis mediterranei TaxID=33910 RepID=A0A0H3CVX0_AMYMU|nr:LLM class flavin-dependent oxidoreductase [Amycolatopsis mediterranei]ADJ42762.1 coenzyme F420-dependent N5,N10-methenyltetrahydromethanopterin reductase [Amycolatopsis mediterranei U32]AEK39453.1 coenzyme F420-dependent N5,N10-methenyltetrahydromethanopterin reductase [Amycolatopsis mediterranei S699]AFO74476.1 coenzyme F420-dependent N5,N10-methenyltetrahydromethanopterin reductase [Amycolatopsis mediterranei S699]AGT81605.1 coenzyme F420-dependent N5,N10-methenyltetrahydromethanopterin re